MRVKIFLEVEGRGRPFCEWASFDSVGVVGAMVFLHGPLDARAVLWHEVFDKVFGPGRPLPLPGPWELELPEDDFLVVRAGAFRPSGQKVMVISDLLLVKENGLFVAEARGPQFQTSLWAAQEGMLIADTWIDDGLTGPSAPVRAFFRLRVMEAGRKPSGEVGEDFRVRLKVVGAEPVQLADLYRCLGSGHVGEDPCLRALLGYSEN